MSGTLTGCVTLDGVPCAGAAVSLLSADGAVLAASETAGDGRYQFAATPSACWVLVCLRSPLIGARAVSIATQPANVEIDSREAVTLAGMLELPAGASPEGIELHLTPRHLAGVPEQARMALITVGTGPALRGTYVSLRLDTPHFCVRLLPGRYSLRAYRAIEHVFSSAQHASDLAAERLILPDGTSPPMRFGGFELEVHEDLEVTVTLRAVGPSAS